MIDTILFDLDGTLLPMDIEVFIKHYFAELAIFCTRFGYEPHQLIEALKKATYRMLNHDGTKTNEEVFWNQWTADLGDKIAQHPLELESFYRNEFIKAKDGTNLEPLAKEAVDYLKNKGYRLILATNPMFPRIATEQRIIWAGLSVDDFIEITTYENYHYTKPNLLYYQEIMDKYNLKPEQCLMIGNDVEEDLVVEKLGIKTYLVTDHLIDRKDTDLSKQLSGSFKEMFDWIKENL